MEIFPLYENTSNVLELPLPTRNMTQSQESRISLQALKTITTWVNNIIDFCLTDIPPRVQKEVFPNSSRESLIQGAKQKYISTWTLFQFQIWLVLVKFKIRRMITKAKRNFGHGFTVQITNKPGNKLKIAITEVPISWREFLRQ